MEHCTHDGRAFLNPCPVCALRQAEQERDEALASIERMSALHTELHASAMEWQAEVERLRDVLRGLAHWVSNLATDDQLDRPAYKTSKSGREWLGDALEFARTDFADKKEKN